MCSHETTAHLMPEAANVSRREAEAVQDRIDRIVSEHPVVLFVKGTPEQPHCGFSAAILKVLGRYDIDVHAVNVLADSALRQGVKLYTDWPTIPQLYVDSVFVGGFDIVRAMHDENSLAGVLGVPRRPVTSSDQHSRKIVRV